MKKNQKSLILCLILFAFTTGVKPPCLKTEALKLPESAEIVIDALSKRTLHEHFADEKKPIASTTKILTALVVLENCALDEVVTVSETAAGTEGSSIYLKAGERLSVEELLYGLMLRSGNDAALALAEHVAGSAEGFVKMMNERARRIGAVNSNFVTPNGLDAEGHYSTARDLALITAEAFNNPAFEKIVATKNYERSVGGVWKNKNKLLFSFDGADGVKTGYTKKSGRCLVASATRSGSRYIAVVLNCVPTFERCAELLSSAFNSYPPRELLCGEEVFSREVFNGIENETLLLKPKSNVFLPVSDAELSLLKTVVDFDENVSLPVKKGVKKGKIEFYIDKDLLFSLELVTINGIEKPSFLKYFASVVEMWTVTNENK